MKGFCPTLLAFLVVFFISKSEGRDIKFINRCGYTIWISPKSNPEYDPLADGIKKIANGKSYSYKIPTDGWAGRFWPKSGCNSKGQACEVGQSVDPCGPNGCDPPAETKVEFNFAKIGSGKETWYDLSLVDGFSLPAELVPSVQQGSCKTTRCAVSLNTCPQNEKDVGDLRVIKNGKTVQCLSPCKKWNYPKPFGLGRPENEEPGQHLCCPTPPISVEQCRQGPVVKTEYVKHVRKNCPTAYSYAYDDEDGLHTCPTDVSFTVKFCP